MPYTALTTADDFDTLLKQASPQQLIVLLFWATWHEPSVQQITVLQHASKDYQQVQFVSIDAESVEGVVERYEQYVSSVPTYIFLRNSKVIDSLEGAQPQKFVQLVQKHSATSVHSNNPAFPSQLTNAQTHATNASDPHLTSLPLEQRLNALTTASPLMVFIKGTPEQPRCGFTKKLLALLKDNNISEYGYFDILSDQTVREGLKKISNWPTYPQVYISGEFVGGLDVVTELVADGEFQQMLPSNLKANGNTQGTSNTTSKLDQQIKQLLQSAPILLFMKGNRTEPLCGFSQKAIGLLEKFDDIEYETFNILEDSHIREGLKRYSNWPTYPQLYVNGELIGGIDVMKEMDGDGELESTLKAAVNKT